MTEETEPNADLLPNPRQSKSSTWQTMRLIVSFGSRALLENCSCLEIAENEFGSAAAQEIIGLIADAEACSNAAELMELHAATDDISTPDSFLVAISSECNVAFTIAGQRFDRFDDGTVDWVSVQRLKMKKISRVP